MPTVGLKSSSSGLAKLANPRRVTQNIGAGTFARPPDPIPAIESDATSKDGLRSERPSIPTLPTPSYDIEPIPALPTPRDIIKPTTTTGGVIKYASAISPDDSARSPMGFSLCPDPILCSKILVRNLEIILEKMNVGRGILPPKCLSATPKNPTFRKVGNMNLFLLFLAPPKRPTF